VTDSRQNGQATTNRRSNGREQQLGVGQDAAREQRGLGRAGLVLRPVIGSS
jgi:hypothetical protein